MGVQVLAIAVWLGSLSLYGAAFFFPEVHRRHDFFWSGVGAFYGLVLWFSAAQTSPTELLGHGASVVLLGWLGWQTLSLRRKRTPLDLQTPVTEDSWQILGRRLTRSAQGLLRGTPLGRWLPEGEGAWLPGDPTMVKDWPPGAIATAEIRASSLKDVDYEFVDELEPTPHPIASPAALGKTSATTAEQYIAPATPPPRRSGRTAPSSAPPPPIAVPPQPRSRSVGTRIAGIRAWLRDGIKAKTTPKPKREVIEIPPRPSPLGRKQPKREVIDIPPRPSPLDRKTSKPPEGDTDSSETVAQETVTIVDTAAVESEAIAPEPSPPHTATAPPVDSEHRPAPSESPPESNWDDDDSNWLDD